MEKFRTSATIVTFHLFKQAIWEHVWKHTIEEMSNMQLMWEHMWKSTFEKMTHMQLMWLCICSSRRFENHIGEISHICNYFAFASIQAGDLWAHVKTHIWENDTYATNVTLHIFSQAIWGDMWTQTFQKNRSHATNVTLHMFKQAIWKS